MTKNQIIDDVAEGLGALVWWDLGGTQIRPENLRTILDDEGISIDVPDIDPLKAARRAAREFYSGRGEGAYKAEVVSHGDATVTLGVLQHQRVSENEVQWVQVGRTTYDSTGGWSYSSVGDSVISDVVALGEKRQTYLDADFVRPKVIQKSIGEMAAFPLRRQGGMYYIPTRYMDQLERLQKVVGRIGDCALHVVHASDTDATRSSIGSEAKHHLTDEVSKLRAKLDDWKDSSRKVRSDALGNAIAAFSGLKDQAELYSDALSIQVDELLSDVAEATEIAKQMLVDGTAKRAERQTGARNDRGVSTRSLERWTKVVGLAVDLDGETVISKASLEAAELPKSTWCSVGQYSLHNTGGRALKELGYVGRLVRGKDGAEPRVVLTKLEAPADTDTDNDCEDASEEPVTVQVDGSDAGETPNTDGSDNDCDGSDDEPVTVEADDDGDNGCDGDSCSVADFAQEASDDFDTDNDTVVELDASEAPSIPKTWRERRAMAKEEGVKGWGNMNKSELGDAIITKRQETAAK